MPTHQPENLPPYEVTYGPATTYPRAWVAHHGGRTIAYVGPRGDGAPGPMTDARRLRIGRDLLAQLTGVDPAQVPDDRAAVYGQWVVREDDLTVKAVTTRERATGQTTHATDYTSRYGGGLWADVTYRHL